MRVIKACLTHTVHLANYASKPGTEQAAIPFFATAFPGTNLHEMKDRLTQ